VLSVQSARGVALLLLGLCVGCKPAASSKTQTPTTAPAPAIAAKPGTKAVADVTAEQARDAPSDPTPPPDLTTPPADAVKTESGLVTRVLVPGTGDRTPKPQDSVRVRFTGWKANGKVIDSTNEHDGPATFRLDGVIRGWAEGLQQMRVGEKRRLWIPDHLSYVRPGPPRGTVVFDIELVEIIEGELRPVPADVAAPASDATKTKSGLAYKFQEVNEGAGKSADKSTGKSTDKSTGKSKDRPHAWDRVTLSYAGWNADGEMFEASSKATFDVGKVMPGWTELLPLMATGDRVLAWIPEALAYQGRSSRPKGTVLFDIELLDIERRPEPPRAPKQVTAPPASAIKTPSGLAYQRLVRGRGKSHPSESSHVQIHYSGWTSDGELFDSSVLRGKPKTVPLSAVIAGWREGIQLMNEGDKTLFWIPEALAYQGKGHAPTGTLVYEIELLKIVK